MPPANGNASAFSSTIGSHFTFVSTGRDLWNGLHARRALRIPGAATAVPMPAQPLCLNFPLCLCPWIASVMPRCLSQVWETAVFTVARGASSGFFQVILLTRTCRCRPRLLGGTGMLPGRNRSAPHPGGANDRAIIFARLSTSSPTSFILQKSERPPWAWCVRASMAMVPALPVTVFSPPSPTATGLLHCPRRPHDYPIRGAGN